MTRSPGSRYLAIGTPSFGQRFSEPDVGEEIPPDLLEVYGDLAWGLWIPDADHVVYNGTPEDGSPVSRLDDWTGNERHFSTAVSVLQPAWRESVEGLPALEFASDRLTLSAAIDAGSYVSTHALVRSSNDYGLGDGQIYTALGADVGIDHSAGGADQWVARVQGQAGGSSVVIGARAGDLTLRETIWGIEAKPRSYANGTLVGVHTNITDGDGAPAFTTHHIGDDIFLSAAFVGEIFALLITVGVQTREQLTASRAWWAHYSGLEIADDD